ncbi:MAG: hypothetical protein IPM78_12920 [Moraxellaceae bacterium]|nr:hypothetical protein [Moraxellaceae bacterium]
MINNKQEQCVENTAFTLFFLSVFIDFCWFCFTF